MEESSLTGGIREDLMAVLVYLSMGYAKLRTFGK